MYNLKIKNDYNQTITLIERTSNLKYLFPLIKKLKKIKVERKDSYIDVGKYVFLSDIYFNSKKTITANLELF